MRLGSLGPVELILIVLAIVLIFGASKLGDIGGALGKSIKEFKKASTDEEDKVARTTTTTVIDADDADRVVRRVETQTVPEKAHAVGATDYRPPDAKAL